MSPVLLLKSEKMTAENRIYIAIDLKSFYASVECVERGLEQKRTLIHSRY